MILHDRCSTSYDLASLFCGKRNSLETWTGKIAQRIGTRPSALHSTFHVWRKSCRIASFLTLSSSKIEGVSQNCCASDAVNFNNWESLADHNYNYNYTTLHYTTSYNINNYITLHYATLHYITLTTTTATTTLFYFHYSTTPDYTTLGHTTAHNTTAHYITLHYIPLHSLHYTHYTTPQLQLQLHYTNYTTLKLQLHYNYNYSCTRPHYIQQLWVRWPLQPLQPLQKTQLQPPFGPSVDSPCHPCITTTHLSYYSVLFFKLPPPPCAVLLLLSMMLNTYTVYIHAELHVYACRTACICMQNCMYYFLQQQRCDSR